MHRVAAWCLVPILGCAACAGGRVGSIHVATAGMSQDQAVQVLTRLGYRDIGDIHKRGTHWIGSADKSGQRVTFDLDKDGNAVDFILSRTVR